MAKVELKFGELGGGNVSMVAMPSSVSIDSSGKVTISNVTGKVVGAVLRYTVSGYDAVVVFNTEKSYYTLSASNDWVEDTAHKITQSGTTATILTAATSVSAKLVYYVQG